MEQFQFPSLSNFGFSVRHNWRYKIILSLLILGCSSCRNLKYYSFQTVTFALDRTQSCTWCLSWEIRGTVLSWSFSLRAQISQNLKRHAWLVHNLHVPEALRQQKLSSGNSCHFNSLTGQCFKMMNAWILIALHLLSHQRAGWNH